MSRVPGWLGRVGAGLSGWGERLERRRAEIESETAGPDDGGDASAGRRRDSGADGGGGDRGLGTGSGSGAGSGTDHGSGSGSGDSEGVAGAGAAKDTGGVDSGAGGSPRSSAGVRDQTAAPVLSTRPDPASAVPWGMRVAAEAGWRLLVLAGTVWVLMRVISSVQLLVLSFTAALLITAMLQPAVARLTRHGVPRGLATALTAALGFVVIGLIGWFVTWQVMENIDDLSDQIQDGIDELQRWLLDSPFHVTENQINDIAKNLREAISDNTDTITSAGLEGVTVIVEALTGILLTVFSTLFLLYDGKRIWQWTLKLVPAAARPGVSAAGPRAWQTLTAYVRGTVVVALIDAIFIGLGIYFLDVPMAVPLAVFIFLFSFIPLVGAVVSGALAVVVALVTQGVFTAVMTLAVVLAVQQIEGHILQPFILGRAVRVHPLAVVLAVAAGGMIAGIGGAVVAVPLVAVTNTVVGSLRAYADEHGQAR
ncbi:AI-2E family transporter [Streptomyces europaeiscabiei]|uniref:AI-2E family transporter n=1 Tax=Streptomyces europaeiscabiei TaxID=146819 RepID=UPI0029BC7F4E|nr:AI-2E family transporter [Streptomyces europaeiscabiei]MDX3691107.1 AI-2E family transporter [Streptomyces europaeiscabiei]